MESECELRRRVYDCRRPSSSFNWRHEDSLKLCYYHNYSKLQTYVCFFRPQSDGWSDIRRSYLRNCEYLPRSHHYCHSSCLSWSLLFFLYYFLGFLFLFVIVSVYRWTNERTKERTARSSRCRVHVFCVPFPFCFGFRVLRDYSQNHWPPASNNNKNNTAKLLTSTTNVTTFYSFFVALLRLSLLLQFIIFNTSNTQFSHQLKTAKSSWETTKRALANLSSVANTPKVFEKTFCWSFNNRSR